MKEVAEDGKKKKAGNEKKEIGDNSSMFNQSVGGLTRVGDADVRSNFAERTTIKKNRGSGAHVEPEQISEKQMIKAKGIKELPERLASEGSSQNQKLLVHEPDDNKQPNGIWDKFGDKSKVMPDPVVDEEDEESDGVIDHIEINLDKCGKNVLVLSFAIAQIGILAVFKLLFDEFQERECNPAVYKLNPDVFSLHPYISLYYDKILMANFAMAIVYKFGSVVCLWLALVEYENLGSNGSYFVSAMLMAMVPSCLMAPMFTYDHVNCMPRNYLIQQNYAEFMCVASLAISVAPFTLYFIVPQTWRRFFCCCRTRNNVRIQTIEMKDGLPVQRMVYKEPLVKRVSSVLHTFISFVMFLLMLGFLVGTAALHVCQYRFMQGAALQSGGANEAWSLFVLLVLACLFKQREVTQQEIEDKMEEIEEKLQEQIKKQMAKKTKKKLK